MSDAGMLDGGDGPEFTAAPDRPWSMNCAASDDGLVTGSELLVRVAASDPAAGPHADLGSGLRYLGRAQYPFQGDRGHERGDDCDDDDGGEELSDDWRDRLRTGEDAGFEGDLGDD